MFDKKAFMFNTQRIKTYSEADYIVKFWGPVFEYFFGTDEHIFLHWYDYFLFKDKKKMDYFWKYTNFSFRGETSPAVCTNNGIKMRLDLRMMVTQNNKFIMDTTNCEYAATPTCSKLFKDRLKLVLGGKAYINEMIKSCPYIDEAEIKKIKLPFVQIMGFNAVLSMISLKDKGVYIIEDVMKFKFPTIHRHIREGQVTKLIKAMSLIRVINHYNLHNINLDK
jgi:hypothetical protein